jgi:hypothetical protein
MNVSDSSRAARRRARTRGPSCRCLILADHPHERRCRLSSGNRRNIPTPWGARARGAPSDDTRYNRLLLTDDHCLRAMITVSNPYSAHVAPSGANLFANRENGSHSRPTRNLTVGRYRRQANTISSPLLLSVPEVLSNQSHSYDYDHHRNSRCRHHDLGTERYPHTERIGRSSHRN